MPATNSVQIELILDIKSALAARALGWWLFGGWGLDAQLGRITREHGDVEFWVEDKDVHDIAALRAQIGRAGTA